MAGSFGHVTDEDTVRLSAPRQIVDMLENGGDVAEAVTEMYGMIVYLARRLAVADAALGGAAPVRHEQVEARIREAEARYAEVVVAQSGTRLVDGRRVDAEGRKPGTWLF